MLYLLDFVLGDLRHGDGQHAVVNLGCYLVLDDILRAKNIPAWIDSGATTQPTTGSGGAGR